MPRAPLAFVTCATDADVLSRCLLASPCLRERRYPLAVHFDSPSAASAFNREMAGLPDAEWLVWVHQDVFLPEGWDRDFLDGIAAAERQMPNLAIAGVYGIAGNGPDYRRAGHVIDRGSVLREPEPLPAEVSSLDELLIAVRTDAGLNFDPALRFDFYGTDVVLAAQAAGWRAAVVEAPCEHHSRTPAQGEADARLLRRVADSAAVFEKKWAHRLPIETPCFAIGAPGDVAKFLERHFQAKPQS
jgi:hypothetical protein